MGTNVEDSLELAQRSLGKANAELAIMLARRKISRSRLREAVLLIEGVIVDLRKLIGEEDKENKEPR